MKLVALYQEFLKAIFDFGNMWQPRIWYLDRDALGANELFSSFFSMLLRSSTSMDARQFLQLWNTPPALHPVCKGASLVQLIVGAFGDKRNLKNAGPTRFLRITATRRLRIHLLQLFFLRAHPRPVGCLCNWWRPCRGTAALRCLHVGLPMQSAWAYA